MSNRSGSAGAWRRPSIALPGRTKRAPHLERDLVLEARQDARGDALRLAARPDDKHGMARQRPAAREVRYAVLQRTGYRGFCGRNTRSRGESRAMGGRADLSRSPGPAWSAPTRRCGGARTDRAHMRPLSQSAREASPPSAHPCLPQGRTN